ncbi:MAG: chromosomal replication initiator protein DnaA, partial [Simkaniaceae bacterium]|nr:chromosomal replication initiator protein DnaA [Simkaniaceae bacterium]
MITCTPKESWAQFLEFIEQRCTKVEFANWFAPIKLISQESDQVVLEVPNIFIEEYLRDNYKEDLAAFLPVDAKGKPLITFMIATSKQEKPKAVKIDPPKPKDDRPHFKLNDLYVFENFIEGPSNQFIKSAALGVAVKPGKSYNPLFIHGGVGLGKTHLLHAIGHYVKQHHRKMRVHCITTEGFINDLVSHLRNKSIDKMKRFYRTLDILLVDDIQFLQNRFNFEEEFCNTFESLINQNKQIVVTSDKPPGDLKLSERMIARMEWGLVAHVGMPDLETRVAILQHKASLKNVKIPSDVAFFIAER